MVGRSLRVVLPRNGWVLVVLGASLAALTALVLLVLDGSEATEVLTGTLAAAIVGSIVGVLALLAVAASNRTVRSAAQLRGASGRPNLATIPYAVVGDESVDGVAMLRDPGSPESEAYRTLRTGLDHLLEGRRSEGGHVVLVTAASDDEGVAAVAANLAVCEAGLGRRVVLIDANLRAPQLHHLFDVDGECGLSSLLRRERGVNEAVHRFPAIPGLVVFAAGRPPNDPVELLAGDDLGKLIAAFTRSVDLVVASSPPVLQFADAAVLARHADAVLLTAQACSTGGHDVVEAIEQLAVVGAQVDGTVLLRPESVASGEAEGASTPAIESEVAGTAPER